MRTQNLQGDVGEAYICRSLYKIIMGHCV